MRRVPMQLATLQLSRVAHAGRSSPYYHLPARSCTCANARSRILFSLLPFFGNPEIRACAPVDFANPFSRRFQPLAVGPIVNQNLIFPFVPDTICPPGKFAADEIWRNRAGEFCFYDWSGFARGWTNMWSDSNENCWNVNLRNVINFVTERQSNMRIPL